MKHRRPVYYGYSNRTIILTIALFCSLFFGLGYSLLGTSLGLNGDVSVSKYDQTLYGVLEKAAKKGTYAKSYDGNHQDSMNSSLSIAVKVEGYLFDIFLKSITKSHIFSLFLSIIQL